MERIASDRCYRAPGQLKSTSQQTICHRPDLISFLPRRRQASVYFVSFKRLLVLHPPTYHPTLWLPMYSSLIYILILLPFVFLFLLVLLSLPLTRRCSGMSKPSFFSFTSLARSCLLFLPPSSFGPSCVCPRSTLYSLYIIFHTRTLSLFLGRSLSPSHTSHSLFSQSPALVRCRRFRLVHQRRSSVERKPPPVSFLSFPLYSMSKKK